MSADVTLSIKEIHNANPVWVRESDTIKPLDKLKQSLREEGMVLPVLLRNDFVVLDGARRIEAARLLGWNEVPVIVAHDWDTVLSYYERLNKLDGAQPAKPMRWVELNELWSTLLKPLHNKARQGRQYAERTRRAHLRAQGVDEAQIFERTSAYTGYTNDCADMFQVRPIHVKLIRDIFNTIGRLKVTRPEVAEPFDQLVAKAEKIGIKTTSTVRHFVRNLSHGVPLDKALSKAEAALSNAHDAPWRLAHKSDQRGPRVRPAKPEIVHPGVGLSVLRNLNRLLEQVSQEAHRFHQFTDEVDPAAVKSIAYDIKTSISRIQSMRRRMEAHGQSLGESEE